MEGIMDCLNEERREKSACVFMDRTKVFDSVNHRILLSKMELMGFRGPTLRLVESYLRNRFQCIQISDDLGHRITSQSEVVNVGGSAGVCLGAFTIFVAYQ